MRGLKNELHAKGWIAFSALSDRGDWDLFVMRPDGSGRRDLARSSDFHEAGIRFSPDGKKMLYYRIPRTEALDNNTYGTYELVIGDSGGRHAEVYGRDFAWASWEPGGDQIACLDRKWVRIIDIATRREVRLLPRKGVVQQLVWSPDGRWFAGTANGLGAYWNVGRMNATTGALNAVSETERYNCTPDWMPDSQRILYSRGIVPERGREADGRAEVWLASGDGTQRRILCEAEKQHLYGSCASPDGAYLLLTASDVDLGRVDNSRTRMMVVRMSDTPVVVGSSRYVEQNYPGASDGAKVGFSLGSGWEPHWTYAEIDFPATPAR
jgi:Tol biopolymer transport system component